MKKVQNNSSRRGFLSGLGSMVMGSAAIGALANLFTAKDMKAASPSSALAAADPYIGSISMVGFNWAPINWALCTGSLLNISSYTSLYSLIGTNYGGDGRVTFGLPNLQGRVPVGQSGSYYMGAMGGSETVTLSTSQIPSHTHTLSVNSSAGTSSSPSNTFIATNAEGIKQYSTSSNTSANGSAIGYTGSSSAHSNMQPYTVVNFIIALDGTYPSRS